MTPPPERTSSMAASSNSTPIPNNHNSHKDDSTTPHILLLDNYDSFTWNLYQLACLQGADVTVVRTQDMTLEELLEKYPEDPSHPIYKRSSTDSSETSKEESSPRRPFTHLLVSPGPGHPLESSGISNEAIAYFSSPVTDNPYHHPIPILGVCLGLQCMYSHFGGTVDLAGEIVHGKTSPMIHDGKGLHRGLEQGVRATRYHSLAGMKGTLPECLEITCRTESGGDNNKGIVMGVRHKELTIEGVQYHPESILSDGGKTLMDNFLGLRGGTWKENPGYGIGETSATSNGANGTSPPAKPSPGQVPTILAQIYARRMEDVKQASSTMSTFPSDLRSAIDLHVAPPPISFYDRLLPRPGGQADSTLPPVSLLAEIKRASPSKGLFVSSSPLDPPPSSPSIALSYALSGASAISVLTEPTWFKGTLGDMLSVRTAIESIPDRPAVLRKDFVFEKYQIDEARVFGADSVLLIVAMLKDPKSLYSSINSVAPGTAATSTSSTDGSKTVSNGAGGSVPDGGSSSTSLLRELYDYSVSLGMEPLVEVNNEEEMRMALDLGAKVIGVNNRNLHNFQVDMKTTSRMMDVVHRYLEEKEQQQEEESGGGKKKIELPILCALSGINSRKDVEGYAAEGVRAVLVGESLMRAPNRRQFVKTLLGLEGGSGTDVSSSNGIHSPSSSSDLPLVKICGVKTPEIALAAAEAGADLLGLMFVENSKRKVSLEEAKDIVSAVRSQLASPTSSTPPSQDADPTDWFSFQSKRLASHPGKPLIVGVFQNPSLNYLLHVIDTLRLDLVQLHGNEPAEWSRLINVPVIKAFHVSPSSIDSDHTIKEATRPGYHAVSLFDTAVTSGVSSGGTGKAFDWSLARKISEFPIQNGTGKDKLPIILAGGLNVGNVAQAVEETKPWAVDVSGGVETDGEKDVQKIQAFVTAAKTAGRQ